jgi:hypothetical protein
MKQWSDEIGYTRFMCNAPSAVAHTMARQLGWPNLFDVSNKAQDYLGCSKYHSED